MTSDFIGRIEAWLRNWRESRRQQAELGAFSEAELEAMARDLGFEDGRGLMTAAARGPDGTALVKQMAGVLGIDLERVAALDPGLARQLELVCNSCDHKKACACDLASGTAHETYQDFCPNAAELKELGS